MRIESKITQAGLDNHKNFSRLTGRDSTGKVVFRQRLEHKDREALREDLRRLPANTPVVLEGTFGWGWMSDELKTCGLDPHLSSSRKTAAWREARGMAKNNKLDADLLSELWSEPERWWEVWLAAPEVRDQREWLRYRMSLVGMQTSVKNRIHATLHRHGVLHEFSDLFGKKGLAFLKKLCQVQAASPQADGAAQKFAPQLSASGRGTLAGYLKLLGQVRQQVAQVTRMIRKIVSSSEEGERWRSLPGVSWVLAYTILAETGQSDRFGNHRKFAAYALLAPRDDDSGDEGGETPTGRRVGHMGRLTLKWAFIEAARSAVRKSEHFRAIFNRRTDGGKRDRGRGYITVGHELSRVGLSCCHYKRDYSEERPARPGSQAAREARWAEARPEDQRQEAENEEIQMRLKEKEIIDRKDGSELRQVSRPGTGGPDHPMVAVARSERRRT
jgi:transposase